LSTSKKKKYPSYFTVGDLERLLQDIPKDLPIGVIGHFGEFIKMTEGGFKIGKASLIPGDGYYWRKMDDYKSQVFEVVAPDIGPEPD